MCDVILAFNLRGLSCFLLVCPGIFDVTQRRELPHEFVRLGGIELLLTGMHAALALDLFPTGKWS